MPLANGIIWSVSSAFCFKTCFPCSCCLSYRFIKRPYGLYLFFIHLCEPRNFCGSHCTGVTPDKFPTLQLHRKREVNERICIEEVGVDPEPLCSCPWTRCRTYHESFS